MIKLIGSIIVFISCVFAGRFASDRSKARLQALKCMHTDLLYAEGEIGSRLMPLPDIIQKLAAQDTCTRQFWMYCRNETVESKRPFEEIWTDSVRLFFYNPEEANILLTLSPVLGRSDAEEERKILLNTAAEIFIIKNDLEKEYSQKKTLYSKLGVAAGLFIVILLI